MLLNRALLAVIFASGSSLALAQSGTPDEQAACRPDVRRFCTNVPADGGDNAVLACLENNRGQLSKKCLDVLLDHNR